MLSKRQKEKERVGVGFVTSRQSRADEKAKTVQSVRNTVLNNVSNLQ